ncbi:hypothetical protein Droror1_Dr00004953 [Drosera rotundifolia]
MKQIPAKSANFMPTIVAGLNSEALSLAVPRAEELFDEMSEPPMVPLLLDFQIDSKYVFEAKTIQRMELLVSCSLCWRMNPVTPFDEGLRLNAELLWGILSKCEEIVLSLITAIVAATMVHMTTMVHMMKDQG